MPPLRRSQQRRVRPIYTGQTLFATRARTTPSDREMQAAYDGCAAAGDQGQTGASVPGGTEGRVHRAGVRDNCALWRSATSSPNPDRLVSR